MKENMSTLFGLQYSTTQCFIPKSSTSKTYLYHIHSAPHWFTIDKAHTWKTASGAQSFIEDWCKTQAVYSNSTGNNPIYDHKNWKVVQIPHTTISPDYLTKDDYTYGNSEYYRIDPTSKHPIWYCVYCKCKIPKDMFALKVKAKLAICSICLADIGSAAKKAVEDYDQEYISKMLADRILAKL